MSPSAPSRRAVVVLVVLATLAALGLALWPRGGPDRPVAADRAASAGSASAPHTARARTRLSGSVVEDPGGTPVRGAIVAAVARGDVSTIQTVVAASDGRFTVELGAGRYSLRAAASGWVQREPLVVDMSGDDVEVTLHVVAAHEGVAGLVVDIESGPIAGAEVRARPLAALRSAAATAVTDDAGRYQLTLGDGNYEISAHHESYVEERRIISVRGGVRRADFRLFAARTIEGRVLRADDRSPVPGACVRLERGDGTAGLFPQSDLECAISAATGASSSPGSAQER